MTSRKKILKALADLLFVTTPQGAAQVALETLVDEIDDGHTSWEQIYVDAFQAAAKAMEPELKHHAGAGGEVGLDATKLRAALKGDRMRSGVKQGAS